MADAVQGQIPETIETRERGRGRAAALFVLALGVLAARPAHAIDIQNFKPAIGGNNLVTLYTSDTLDHLQFGFALTSSYASDPLVFEFPNNDELAVVERLMTTDFMAYAGFFRFIEIGVAGNYNTAGGTDMDIPLSEAFPDTGMELDSAAGDVRIAAKFRILENKTGSVGVALVPLFSIPNGDEEVYVGAEGFDTGARLVIDKRFDRVNIVLNGGYIRMGDSDVDLGFEPTGRVELGAGASLYLHRAVDITGEIFARTVDYGIEEIDPELPTEGLVAARFYAGPVSFTVGGGAGVNAGIGNPSYRGFGEVAFAWPKLDRAYEGGGGASATSNVDDTDKDGLTNYQETRIYKTDFRNPDTDGDGLKDGEEINAFRTDPLKDDTDGDGLIDFEELKVYYTDPLQVDSDGDTLEDGAEVKQYRTNPTDPDTDRDGVPDNLDAAPLEPETINGILDEDGVPEVILARRPSGVTMTDTIVWTPAPIEFMGKAKDVLSPDSRAMLAEVAALLADYPRVKIEIQAHTAGGGDEAANRARSAEQAKAAAGELYERGIASERVAWRGYGSAFPIASDASPEGRARNERIEILVIEN
ncbi:OmpA family protein [bacterium]|nr:OmpA family protein [bacterium]